MAKSAVEIVRAYGIDAWSEGRDDWIPELCADPIIRHDANREVRLSHAEQRARMRHNYDELRPRFTANVLAGDDEHVTLVWNVTGRDPNWKLCGIEVFRVVDSRIVEVWNSTYMEGRWGLSQTVSAALGDAAMTPIPLVRSDLSKEGTRVSGTLVVPVDARAIAMWMTHCFGAPATTRSGPLWSHRFTPGGQAVPLRLAIADAAGESFDIDRVATSAIAMELEPSGLVNATVTIDGDGAAAHDADAGQLVQSLRLAETIGLFDPDGVAVRVVDAAITISANGKASGRVALRLADSRTPPAAGHLSLGWRQGDHMLMFEGEVSLAPLAGGFTDGDEMEARYEWHAESMTAMVVNDMPHVGYRA